MNVDINNSISMKYDAGVGRLIMQNQCLFIYVNSYIQKRVKLSNRGENFLSLHYKQNRIIFGEMAKICFFLNLNFVDGCLRTLVVKIFLHRLFVTIPKNKSHSYRVYKTNYNKTNLFTSLNLWTLKKNNLANKSQTNISKGIMG